MKTVLSKGILASIALFGAVSAQAITFSNVTIFGPSALIGVVTQDPPGGGDTIWKVGVSGNDLDISFGKAFVGDTNPNWRFAVINITYEAKSDTAIVLDQLNLSGDSLLKGSGHMNFTETIEDVAGGTGVIGSFSKDFFAGQSGGFAQNIPFARQSKWIKVKKTIQLDAFDTQALDIAKISFVEQNLITVPEPTSVGALGIGLVALVARRKRGGR